MKNMSLITWQKKEWVACRAHTPAISVAKRQIVCNRRLQRTVRLLVEVPPRQIYLHIPFPSVIRVGIAFHRLGSLNREQLEWAQQPLLGQSRLILLHMVKPLFSIICGAVVGEPRATFCVVDRSGKGLAFILIHGIPLNKKVPLEGDLTNQVVVLDPCKAVQVGTPLAVDQLKGHRLVRWMATIPQHHAAPVLARVGALRAACQLGSNGWLVVMLHAHQRLGVIHHVQELSNVLGPQKIVVHKHRPALVVVEIGHEEAAVGELRGLLRVLRASVDAPGLQLIALERDDLHRHGCILKNGVLGNLKRDILMRVVTHVHAEGHIFSGELLAHALRSIAAFPLGVRFCHGPTQCFGIGGGRRGTASLNHDSRAVQESS
mmetsp:Transcript_3787/g.7356  ORF Transcript_3787/g.7356 Transcript_3787/m.7356 type:complete len:375 (+) Transcript_3787:362-1486(+)